MHETPQPVNPQSPIYDGIAVTTPKQFTLAIVESVAARHDVPVAAILGRCRMGHIVAARHEAIVEVVEARPHWSYPTVGRLFGKDHTTIMHALKKAGKWKRRGVGAYRHHEGVVAARSVADFVSGLQIDWQGGEQ